MIRDAPAVLAAFAPPDRPDGPLIVAEEAAPHWTRARAAEWDTGTGYAFAVVDRHDAVLGNVSVTPSRPGPDGRDVGWISYWTVPVVRGRGVATRGVRALARWSHDDLGLFRLELGHRIDNPASCVVAVRAGFRVDGPGHGSQRIELHARLASDPEISYPRWT